MDDLARWLGEQLDVDERIAETAPRGPWRMDGSGSIVDADGARVVPSVGASLAGRTSRWPEGRTVDHMLGHDPARVLREIDAKRAIVDDLAECIRWGAYKGLDFQDGVDACERTLTRLALPYADRPGYLEKWRP